MKKIFITIVFITICMMSFGQNWKSVKTEGDELKGTKPSTAIMYDNPQLGCFVTWGYDCEFFRIITYQSFFNYETERTPVGYVKGAEILVGLYTKDNVLCEKFKMWMECEDDKPEFLETRRYNKPIGQKKKVQKIIKHLMSTDGYVRIVVPLYHNPDFDFKINSLKNNNFDELTMLFVQVDNICSSL